MHQKKKERKILSGAQSSFDRIKCAWIKSPLKILAFHINPNASTLVKYFFCYPTTAHATDIYFFHKKVHILGKVVKKRIWFLGVSYPTWQGSNYFWQWVAKSLFLSPCVSQELHFLSHMMPLTWSYLSKVVFWDALELLGQ